MSEDKQEQELEAYLQGDSELSKVYKEAAKLEPGTSLDEKILAASRREVKAKPRFAHSPFAGDWHVPASLAAVLVLSVGVVITMQQETNDYAGETTSTTIDGFADYTEQHSPGIEEDEKGQITADSIATDEFGKLQTTSASIQGALRNSKSKRRLESEKVLKKERAMLRQAAPVVDEPKAAFDFYKVQPGDSSLSKDLSVDADQVEARIESVIVTARKREEALAQEPMSVTVLEEVVVAPGEKESLGLAAVTGAAFEKDSVKAKLQAISKLWKEGDKEQALENLKQFLKEHSDYGPEDLREHLSKELIDLTFE